MMASKSSLESRCQSWERTHPWVPQHPIFWTGDHGILEYFMWKIVQYCTYKIQQFQVQYQQLVHRKVCKQLSLNIRHTRTPEPEFKHTNKSRRIRILEVSNFYIPFPTLHSPLTYSLLTAHCHCHSHSHQSPFPSTIQSYLHRLSGQ